MEITKELIAKAKSCKTEDELKALANENNIELTDYEIKLFLAQNREYELAEEELEAVSGGQKGCKRNAHETVYFNSKEEVKFIFDVGDVLQAFICENIGNETATVRITERSEGFFYKDYTWFDCYKYDRISGPPTVGGSLWHKRSRFEK